MKIAIRFACIAILSVIVVACGSGHTAEEYIARANLFIAESDYDSAVIELKNALQQDSQSSQARWLLGKVYLESGDVLSAEKELQRAQELGWSPDDVMPALAESLLAQGRYTEVEKLSPAGLGPQAEANLLSMRALAAMAIGEKPRAKRLVDRALEIDPQSTTALMTRARLLASQGDLSAAHEVLETVLANEPNNGAAWGLIGDIRAGQRNPEEALAAYEQAIALQPNDYDIIFKRALLSLQSGNLEAAQTDATTLMRIAPQNQGANYIQGVIHFQAGNYRDSITALSLAEPAFKQFPLVLLFLGNAQLVEGNTDQAAVYATRFYGIAPENIQGRKLLATIQLQQGKYAEVETLLRPVLETNPDDVGALNLMANALLRGGKTDEGITLLSRVAQLQPDSPIAQVKLGASLLMGGRSDDAAQHMEAALELNPEFQQADILLVLNHVQKRDYAAAIEAAEAYRRRNLTSTTPLNLLGRVYLAAGQQGQATEAFEKSLAFDNGDPAANHNLAQMAVANNDLPKARQYYTTILEHQPNYLPALIQLALLDAREDNGAALVEHLEQAIDAHPNAIQPRILLGRYYLSQGRPEKVGALFSSLDAAQRQSPQVLQLVALAQLAQNEHEKALYTLEQLNNSAADTAATHHLMAIAAAGNGDVGRAEQELHESLKIDENYLPPRIELARLALAQGKTDEFEQQLEILSAQAPEHPDVLLLRAISANQKGDSDTAVKLAEQAFALAPDTKSLLALGFQKEAAGDRDGALELYLGWADNNEKDVAVIMRIANSLLVANKADEALPYYERVIKLDPDNTVALNNLAWYLRQENTARALEYARHADQLAPDNADITDTLAVVEYYNEDYKQARRTIDRALAKNPDHPSLKYHKAMISAAMGESASAIKILEALLDGGADFPEKEQANQLLTTLKQ